MLPVSPSSSQMAMASCAVLYLTGMRSVLLVQKMSDSVKEIFLMSEPVMFHTVLSLIRLPDGVGTYVKQLVNSSPSCSVNILK